MGKKYEDLHELDNYQLENPDQDMRGQPLCTYDGKKLGTVQRMLVDPDHDHVAALVLDDHRYVPVSEVELRDGKAYIDPIEADGFGVAPPRERTVPRGRIVVHPRT